MISSTSARKRAEGVYEDSFVNPQFEQGRKKVPQAELEHVSPEPQEPQYTEQQSATEVKSRSIRENVSEHLQKISKCLNQINNLTSEIQVEKESIKRILQDLHA